ncbi:hypothetical protein Gohar_021147 [Gossypium harknessii]|uniref:RNase H type-1 domain-containing protein n=1 Tax=Gossypium harknessii TaxID=34285 RepID=A0A7J9I9U9_9ROSI|nr:hypothetical protein [Gossypium harknessii]
MGFGSHRFFWKAIRKLDIIPKVRVFTGHVGHEILPNSAILSIGGPDDNTILKDYKCCINWLEDMMRILDKKKARTLSQEFCICNLINEPLLSSNPVVQKWEKPPKGFVKINFDALVYNNKVNYGVIARDEDGFVLGGGGGLNGRPISVEEAKYYTFEESIKLPCRLNIKSYVIFETNNACFVNKLKNHRTYIMINDTRIKESKKAFANFKLADLVWTNHSCNIVADLICKKMYTEVGPWFFDMDYPSDIHDVVIFYTV